MPLIDARALLFTLLFAGCGSGASAVTVSNATPGGLRPWNLTVDPDGVAMLHPSKPHGLDWRLGDTDLKNLSTFKVHGAVCANRTEGSLKYWNLEAQPVSYSNGEVGWTTSIDVYNSGIKRQRFDWKTQKGFLGTVKDPKDQEVTIYMRGHGGLSPSRLQWAIKIRGGEHSTRLPDRASCTMMTFGANSTRRITKFGKELTHPYTDYVKLRPLLPGCALEENIWYGLKLVSYRLNNWSVLNQLWLDTDPWDANGNPKNGWRMMSEFVDVRDKTTGRYSQVADWGGLITSVRTDGWHDVDFSLFSVREIRKGE
jgi:hypothetical protein